MLIISTSLPHSAHGDGRTSLMKPTASLLLSSMAKVRYAIPSHYREREDGWIYLARPLDLCPEDLFSAPQADGFRGIHSPT